MSARAGPITRMSVADLRRGHGRVNQRVKDFHLGQIERRSGAAGMSSAQGAVQDAQSAVGIAVAGVLLCDCHGFLDGHLRISRLRFYAPILRRAENLRKRKMRLARDLFSRHGMGMKTASDIITAVGRDSIKATFGVADRVLQLYAKQNRLPSAWFDRLEKMTGQELPRILFSFKPAADAD